MFYDSFQLVTALKMFSRTDKAGKPLLTYKEADQMVSWFSGNNNEQYDGATLIMDFINQQVFHE